jgi:uncharacterized C2H2 Zn-finger protein
MTKKPSYCPICYNDVTKCKEIKEHQINGINVVIRCSKCHTLLNADNDSINIRCPVCMRLFTDTLSYIDHKEHNVCNNVIRGVVNVY